MYIVYIMQPINAHPLRDQVAERLREAIESGSLSPSANLKEVEVAADLGVSRTPMREALVQLEKEGFVVLESGRGFRVASVSVEDAIQIERLVASLERLSLEESPTISDREYESLRALHEKFASEADVARRQKLDDRWHALLTSRCANRWTMRTLEPLKGHSRRYGAIYLGVPGNHERSVQEHEEVLEQLKLGDNKAAGRLLEVHWIGGIARANADEPHRK